MDIYLIPPMLVGIVLGVRPLSLLHPFQSERWVLSKASLHILLLLSSGPYWMDRLSLPLLPVLSDCVGTFRCSAQTP